MKLEQRQPAVLGGVGLKENSRDVSELVDKC